MTGVAVNVTEPPLQIDVVLAIMDTKGVTDIAVMVIGLLVAVVGAAQGSLLVITAVITSPLANEVDIKVDAVCPAIFTPFVFH